MKNKLTIEEMQAIAKSRGGKCLSKKYVNAHSKLEWECSEGHIWKALPCNIKQGKWCNICSSKRAGKSKRLELSLMHKIAKSRGGKCLSKEYVNANSKLEWECAYGHRWKATPGKVHKGYSWCNECSSSISERICRAYFQQLFGKKFPKSRPRWLKNNRCNQMELDGYCKELRIAFEHQGEQHYTSKSYFSKTKQSLKQRKEDDRNKSQLCEKNGVRLIAIPQLFTRTKLEDLQRFIYEECKRLHIRCSKSILGKKIKLKSAWLSEEKQKRLIEANVLADSKQGKCLSSVYQHSKLKLEWQCQKGHRWKATFYDVVKNDSWCDKCRSEKKLEELKAIAKSHGGKCLSKEYVDTNTKLKWKCSEGHRWEAKPSKVKEGTWCRKCSFNQRRLTIEEMQEIANSHGGKCLSKEYVNNNTKLKWECSKGHRWLQTPRQIKHTDSWCQKCRKK